MKHCTSEPSALPLMPPDNLEDDLRLRRWWLRQLFEQSPQFSPETHKRLKLAEDVLRALERSK